MSRKTKPVRRGSKKDGLPEEPPKNGPAEPPMKEKSEPPEELKQISDSNLQHLFALAFKIGDWLYTLWNYYFVLSTALVGWLISTQTPWLPERKLLFALVYALAWLVNFGLILHNFRFLYEVLRAAEKEFAEGRFFKSDEMNEYLRHITRRVWWIFPLLVFHVLIAVFVIMFILSLTPGRRPGEASP
jgi:hypothetical protein